MNQTNNGSFQTNKSMKYRPNSDHNRTFFLDQTVRINLKWGETISYINIYCNKPHLFTNWDDSSWVVNWGLFAPVNLSCQFWWEYDILFSLLEAEWLLGIQCRTQNSKKSDFQTKVRPLFRKYHPIIYLDQIKPKMTLI